VKELGLLGSVYGHHWPLTAEEYGVRALAVQKDKEIKRKLAVTPLRFNRSFTQGDQFVTFVKKLYGIVV
jgi:hypothetical protein